MSTYYGAVHSVNGCFIYIHTYTHIHTDIIPIYSMYRTVVRRLVSFLALILKRFGRHYVVLLTVCLHKWRPQYNRQVHNRYSE